ncbi:ABC transporter ATP-binding protein [Oculatella sp. FACHB-28]|uniref:ABC transporter ATP-binding protein n=1 Tax=Cyanophyceae TaxID=3028117 RepID=UPI00168946D2|nr:MULTISPECIES: ABC transporter ATP-binding protein [Cyanophyceae]MBD1871779.1 ABC transporter ATP-binding protein [Cyanobacteria bacterium FACHB-471]MBD2057831.1 ABC transporter ATP-binding protein [Oculatella sp. FACHB-28]MBD2069812.1 ABC transporter ATP-binding protein [Leptolyngbya sp. FACHB-671]
MIKPTANFANTSQTANSPKEFLVIENVTKAYPTPNGGETVVLDDINLNIGENEYISIIGHSGCGKSTLLKIVGGLEKATSGSIWLGGREVRKPGAERMMVFQHYSLLPWLTVRENIRLAVDEVLDHLSPADKKQVVNEHIAMVNLNAAAEKYPDELSGGMKQRVGIARALAIRPKMLLMDEPFGALDALTRGRLQRQVLDIWENQRQAVMMVTHDVDEALYMSDRIIMMTNGPHAKIGEILDVPFEHPRVLKELRSQSTYYDLRNHALNFLDQHFSQDD